MKSTFFSILTILFLTFGTTVFAQDSTAASPETAVPSMIKIATEITKKQVPLNRTVVLKVTLSWLGDPDRYEITDFENPALSNFDIVGTATANKTEVIGGKVFTRRVYEFTLKPRELGMGYVEGVMVKYKDRAFSKEGSLLTNRIGLKVTEAVPEKSGGIAGEAVSHWPATILLIALIIIAAGILWFFFVYRKSREKSVQPEYVPPVEETYLARLKELIHFDNLDLKNDFGRLGKFLRGYLAEKFDLPAKQATTAELIEEMKRRNLDDRLVAQTGEVLGVADAVMFSGGKGSREELEKIYGSVEAILEHHLREAQQVSQVENQAEN